MRKGKIVIISGPSGSGKTTLYQKLLASTKLKGKIVKSISVTTRPKRKGEKNGRDYYFISRKMFLYKRRSGHFLESEKVFDNYYATPQKKVRETLKSGRNVLLSIDVKGARQVCQQFPSAITIFITVPSMKVLEKRLRGRGSEKNKTIRLRLQTAKKELLEAKKYNHIIINNDLTKSYKKLERLVCKELEK